MTLLTKELATTLGAVYTAQGHSTVRSSEAHPSAASEVEAFLGYTANWRLA